MTDDQQPTTTAGMFIYGDCGHKSSMVPDSFPMMISVAGILWSYCLFSYGNSMDNKSPVKSKVYDMCGLASISFAFLAAVLASIHIGENEDE